MGCVQSAGVDDEAKARQFFASVSAPTSMANDAGAQATTKLRTS
jgi:hypothetical protein